MATSAAAVGNSIIRDLERYLSYIHEDVRGHALASIRGAALSGRLRRLVEGAVQRIKQRQMQIGLLAPIRTQVQHIISPRHCCCNAPFSCVLDQSTDASPIPNRLLREISSFTTVLKNSNLIRLLVSRDRVAQQLRAFQLRTSNLASRLQVSSDFVPTDQTDMFDRTRMSPFLVPSFIC